MFYMLVSVCRMHAYLSDMSVCVCMFVCVSTDAYMPVVHVKVRTAQVLVFTFHQVWDSHFTAANSRPTHQQAS